MRVNFPSSTSVSKRYYISYLYKYDTNVKVQDVYRFGPDALLELQLSDAISLFFPQKKIDLRIVTGTPNSRLYSRRELTTSLPFMIVHRNPESLGFKLIPLLFKTEDSDYKLASKFLYRILKSGVDNFNPGSDRDNLVHKTLKSKLSSLTEDEFVKRYSDDHRKFFRELYKETLTPDESKSLNIQTLAGMMKYERFLESMRDISSKSSTDLHREIEELVRTKDIDLEHPLYQESTSTHKETLQSVIESFIKEIIQRKIVPNEFIRSHLSKYPDDWMEDIGSDTDIPSGSDTRRALSAVNTLDSRLMVPMLISVLRDHCKKTL